MRSSAPSGLLECYSTALAQVFPDNEERQPIAKWIGDVARIFNSTE